MIAANEPYLVAEGGTVPCDINHVLNFTITDSDGNKTVYFGNTTLLSGSFSSGFSKDLKISDFTIMGTNNIRDGDDDVGSLIISYTSSWIDRFGVVPSRD